MKNLYLALVVFSFTLTASAGTVGIQDEGGLTAWGAAKINCTGDGLECSKTGIVGTVALDLQTLTGPLCWTVDGGTACFTFDGETLDITINDSLRQDWTTSLALTNYDFEDGTNYEFEDGTNYDFN